LSEKPKEPFYKSCLFWIVIAMIWITVADMIAMLLPAWHAARLKQEQERSAEQSSP
jgi:hypothetical protein